VGGQTVNRANGSDIVPKNPEMPVRNQIILLHGSGPLPAYLSRAGNFIRRSIGGFLLGLLICSIPAGCGNKVQPKAKTGRQNASVRPARVSGTRVLQPSNDQQFTLGDDIPFKLEKITDTVPDIDSMELFIDGARLHTMIGEPDVIACSSRGLNVGTRPVRIIGHYADGRKEYHDLNIILLSDIVPQYIHYKIVNTWPHDQQAYTQGLVYEAGYLYEGTGQWSESSLRKTEITTGEPVRLMLLPDDVFGEGITLFNDKIYQLTYKSQVGFVYEKESFKRIRKVYYENKEGWGLTHDGRHLIMSDGSHRIYFMDPEYFTEVRRIEVYDDKGPVSRLNELEYIEGRIFANIYGEEEIVIIDPEGGKVTARLNMRGILPEGDRHRGIDVFNGIAWDPEKRILYVTGKYWPRLFEISLQADF
jgi:glutamine cyclotransferase